MPSSTPESGINRNRRSTSQQIENERSSEVADNLSYNEAKNETRSFWLSLLKRLFKEQPWGAIGGTITMIMLLVGIFAGMLAPYGMNETNVAVKLSPPSSQHLLGTDHLGRDILSRVIYGARISVIVGLSASVIATALNILIGVVSGYVGGKLDMIVQRLVDAALCIPNLILLMVFISIIGTGMWQIIVVLGISWGINSSRIIRSAVIGIIVNPYVQAAMAIGASTPRILFRHILPNIMAPTIIIFTIRVPAVILAEAALSFLGLGIPPPAPSWGGMLSGAGRAYMFEAPWMAFWPGLALALVVYFVNMFGDAVRDILDPRMRGGGGRFGHGVRATGGAVKPRRLSLSR